MQTFNHLGKLTFWFCPVFCLLTQWICKWRIKFTMATSLRHDSFFCNISPAFIGTSEHETNVTMIFVGVSYVYRSPRGDTWYPTTFHVKSQVRQYLVNFKDILRASSQCDTSFYYLPYVTVRNENCRTTHKWWLS